MRRSADRPSPHAQALDIVNEIGIASLMTIATKIKQHPTDTAAILKQLEADGFIIRISEKFVRAVTNAD